MTRLGRRASLLVAFYLLTSAATAYAECAWVLWSDTRSTIKVESGGTYTSSPDVKVVQAEANQTGCEKALDTLVAMAEASAKPAAGATATVIRLARGRALVTFTYPESNPRLRDLAEYVCLPDTVDPRGPKGK